MSDDLTQNAAELALGAIAKVCGLPIESSWTTADEVVRAVQRRVQELDQVSARCIVAENERDLLKGELAQLRAMVRRVSATLADTERLVVVMDDVTARECVTVEDVREALKERAARG